MYIDEAESDLALKAFVEAQVGGALSHGAWGNWIENIRGDEVYFNNKQEMAELLVERIEFAKRNLPRPKPREIRRPESDERTSTSLAPPEWWASHSEMQIDRCLEHQSRALELFQLQSTISIEEADLLISREVESQPRDGLAVAFEYAHLNPDIDRVNRYVTPAIAYTGRHVPAHRLHFFALLAKGVARLTGCEVHQASTFLLTGELPSQPWVRTTTYFDSGVIDIRIGNPAATASDVKRAYLAAAEQIKTKQAEVVEPRRRQRRPRTIALLNFMRAQEQGRNGRVEWDKSRAAWNALYPQWEFGTDKNMYEAHRKATASTRGTAE